MPLNNMFFRALLENISDGVYCVDTDRKIFYWNKGAEKITGFNRDQVVGTCCSDNILKHVDDAGKELCKEHCPLVLSMAKGTPIEAEVYLHHKDGYRLPVVIRVDPIRNSSGTIVGAVEIFRSSVIINALRDKLKEYEQVAMLDDLTKLATRKYVELNLGTRIAEAKRYGRNYGVMFVDLDNFKGINDRFGHDIGDKVLKMVSATLRNNIRFFDVAGRWGGDEFIVMVEVTAEQDMQNLAEKLKTLVEKSFLDHESHIVWTTVSIGATLLNSSDSIESAIQRADKLMYQSKQAGRNKVTIG